MMITRVFNKKGKTMFVADAYAKLLLLNPSDPYIDKKAAGSLGGALASGFLVRNGKVYKRVR